MTSFNVVLHPLHVIRRQLDFCQSLFNWVLRAGKYIQYLLGLKHPEELKSTALSTLMGCVKSGKTWTIVGENLIR
jgi:hypothetical protein